MKILDQSKQYMVDLESFCGLSTAIKDSPKNDKSYVSAIAYEKNAVKLGEYSSEEKAKMVLVQIFEHTGETFIMPQDEEVEV